MNTIDNQILEMLSKAEDEKNVRDLYNSALHNVKAICPIRSGNMLNHIKGTNSTTGAKILVRAYKYDERIFNRSLYMQNRFYRKHSNAFIEKNLDKPRFRYNTYYAMGYDLERKYMPKGIVQRLKMSPHTDFNYAAHTNDADTYNKGWVFLALRIAVNEFCAKNNGEIELWNLR